MLASLTTGSRPRPRITALGVVWVAVAYGALALFYAATISWSTRPETVLSFIQTTASLVPQSVLDYAIKGALTVPVWWIVVRTLDEFPWQQAVAHVVLCPLWVVAWFWCYRLAAGPLGYGVLSGGGESWDVYIPTLVYLAQFGAFHAAQTLAEVRRRGAAERDLLARQADLERAARDAQLAALRAQMDPHFLFNTLTSVAASVPPEQGATRDLVARLAGLVRYTLAAARRPRVLLREEIAFVQDYLALERERMGDRLRIEIDVDEAALDMAVPPMLIQPLVENAVRHGLAPSLKGGTVRVYVRRYGSSVHVLVQDDGVGSVFSPKCLLGSDATQEGIGLSNTDARLRAVFGAGLTLGSPGSGDGEARGFEARFVIPFNPDRTLVADPS